jgi:Na+/alanine symporter
VYRIDGDDGSRGGALDCIARLIPERIVSVLFCPDLFCPWVSLHNLCKIVEIAQLVQRKFQASRTVALSLSRFAQRVLAPRLR